MISWKVDDASFTDHRYAVYVYAVCNIVVLVIRVCEDTPLKVLLEKYLHPTESDPVIRHR